MKQIVTTLLLSLTLTFAGNEAMAQATKKPVPSQNGTYVPPPIYSPIPVYNPPTNQPVYNGKEVAQIDQQIAQIKQQQAALKQQLAALRQRRRAITGNSQYQNGQYQQEPADQEHHDNGKHKGWKKNGKSEGDNQQD